MITDEDRLEIRQIVAQVVAEAILNHRHKGLGDAYRINGKDLVKAPQAAITTPSTGAGAAYTATEQGIINQHATVIQEIIDALKELGLTL